jgi:hypothetical protein
MPLNCSSGLLLGLCTCVGCAHTQDLSNTPEYKPWIGKTVSLTRQENVFSPTWSPCFLSGYDSYRDYHKVATLPGGYPVVIEAVKRTEGRFLLTPGGYIDDQLVLSIELPGKATKRITVWSDLGYVEPFRDKESLHHSMPWERDEGP